jgi:hypothetical protein
MSTIMLTIALTVNRALHIVFEAITLLSNRPDRLGAAFAS